MGLMEIYLAKYGAKTPAAAPEKEDGAAKLAELIGEKDPEKAVKLASAYEELGRRLARETFAAEAAGLVEPPAEEKKAEAEPSADDLIKQLLGEPQEKKSGDQEFDAFIAALVKTGEDEKEAALKELGTKILSGLKAGKEKTVGGMKALWAAAKGGNQKAQQLLKNIGAGIAARKRELMYAGAGAAVGAAAGAGGTALATRKKEQK